MPIRSVSFVERLILRSTFLFYLPRVALRMMKIKLQKNPLHDGKRQLSGIKKLGTSSDLRFDEVKAASKHFKVTINDIVTCCLGNAVKQYFVSKNDTET